MVMPYKGKETETKEAILKHGDVQDMDTANNHRGEAIGW